MKGKLTDAVTVDYWFTAAHSDLHHGPAPKCDMPQAELKRHLREAREKTKYLFGDPRIVDNHHAYNQGKAARRRGGRRRTKPRRRTTLEDLNRTLRRQK